jgi:flagellar biosynthesis protein FliR
MMPTVPVFFIALPIANLAGIAILVASIGFILTNYSAPMAEWLTTLRL